MDSDPRWIPLHLGLLFLTPPFFLGLIAKTKAFFGGRQGPPLLQAYYDIAKLLRKGSVHSTASSFLSRTAPWVIACTPLCAGLLVPLAGQPVLHFPGDVILFAYALALGRFFTMLAAMDAGSSFEGMGASREATFGALCELSFFLGLIILSVSSGSLSFREMFAWRESHALWNPAFLLLFVSFFLVLLAENARIPIDDPNTHLELTMIHEVMVLDYSGPELGLILYGASVKLFVFMAVTASLLLPQACAWGWNSLGWFLLKMAGMAVAIGVVESANARLRMIKVPQLLIANFLAVALALLVTWISRSS